MRATLKRRSQNAGRPAWKVAVSFQKWVRGFGCCVADKGGCGDMGTGHPVEFAHVDYAGGKGMGTKVADRFGIPLCPRHHAEQGGQIGPFRSRGGWPTFEAKYGIKADEVALKLWLDWPGRAAWERDQS
jgi:hypothetical protein